jgi:glycosyltransferase involved in cell wall biosynthesis
MLLSVITPSFNQAAFLPETLASVREAASLAAPHEIEHWVQDGGSTDGTKAILEAQSFAGWESAPDQGQAQAINLGWSRCSGEVMTFLCSDDLWEPGALPRVLEVFATHPEVDVVYGDFFFLEGTTGWKRRKTAGPWSRERLFSEGNFISQPATFWRRQVYEKFGGLDESLRYVLDFEYWLRISASTTWHYLPEPLAAARLHPDAKTSAQLTAMCWEGVRMQKRYHSSWKPFFHALRMQLYGAAFYRLKRHILQRLAPVRGVNTER